MFACERKTKHQITTWKAMQDIYIFICRLIAIRARIDAFNLLGINVRLTNIVDKIAP